MRRVAWLIPLAIVVACSGSPSQPATDNVETETLARSALYSMAFGLRAAGETCDAHFRRMARTGDIRRLGRAEAFGEECVSRLLPPRDAIHFAAEVCDPWQPQAASAVGCAGRTTRYALEALRELFDANGAIVPPALVDGIRMGAWAERFAPPDCDPRYPMTRVRVERP